MMKKTKRDKLFRLRLEGDMVEFESAMFDGVSKEKKRGNHAHLLGGRQKARTRNTLPECWQENSLQWQV